MKKGLIFATALAMVLGVGAAVGARQAKALNVRAYDSRTVYCAIDTTTLGSYTLKLNCNVGDNNTWVQSDMVDLNDTTSYPGKKVFKGTFEERWGGVDAMQFQLYDGGNWHAQDQVISSFTSYENYSGKLHVYGGAANSWASYTELSPATEYNVTCVVGGVSEDPIKVAEGSLPAAKADTYAQTFDGWYTTNSYQTKVTEITADCSVYGRFVNKATASYTIDDGYAKKFSDYYLYAWNSDGNNAGWPGAELDSMTFTIPTDATFVINDGDTQQTVDINQTGAKDYLKLLNTVDGQGHFEVEWADDPTDVPATEGYYIKGSASSWLYTAANKMSTENLNQGDVAQFIGFTAHANDEIRVCSYYTDRTPFEQWSSLENGTSEVGTLTGNNLKFTADGTYDIYAKYVNDAFLFCAFAHQEPQPDPVYTVKYLTYTFTFELDDDNKPEGSDHQYVATLSDCGHIWRARELEFYADDVKITSNIGVDYDMQADKPVEGNNIVGDVTNGFKVYTSNTGMTVYMKQYGNWFSLWGTGFVETTYYLSLNNTMLHFDTTFEPNSGYIKQYCTTNPVSIARLNAAEENQNYYISDDLGGSVNLNMETAGQNNAVAKSIVYFDVHNDCNQRVFLKMKADLSLWLYIGGYEEAHVLTIGGKTVNLTKSGETEYVAHEVALSAGDTVTSYTIEGSPVAVTSKKVANNNLDVNKKVIANVASADIYFDTSANTLWISGLPAAGQHLLKNGNTAIEMTHTDPYGDYDQYASGMLTFAANDTIKVLNTGADDSYAVVWCPEIVATSTALTGKFVYDSENHVMKCVSACSAAVYLKIKSGVDEVYFGDVPEYVEEAVEYVNGFKSAMATACSAQNKQSAVELAWAAQAEAFSGLTSQAQAEIRKGLTSLVSEIQEFAQRYISIKQQHSTWHLDNFLDITIPPSGRIATIFDTIITSESSVAIIIVAIAVVSFASLAVYLVIKKRKHQ